MTWVICFAVVLVMRTTSAWNLRVCCKDTSFGPFSQNAQEVIKVNSPQRIYCFLKYGVYGRHQQVWVQVGFLSREVDLSPTMGCWYTTRLPCWKEKTSSSVSEVEWCHVWGIMFLWESIMSLNQLHELLWVALCWLMGSTFQQGMDAVGYTGEILTPFKAAGALLSMKASLAFATNVHLCLLRELLQL